MNQLARIFIVMNLLLAAGFLFAAGVFLAKNENWKKEYELKNQEVENLNGDIATLKKKHDEDVKIREQTKNALEDQNKGLEVKVGQLEAELKNGRESLSKAEAEKIELNSNLSVQANNVSTLTQLTKDLDTKAREALDKRLEAETALSEREKTLAEANDKVRQQADTIAGHERTIETLRKERGDLELLVRVAQEQGFDLAKAMPMKPVNAQVTKFDPGTRLVMINRGADAGIARGYVIDVVRSGMYIGRFRVDDVGPNWSAGVLVLSKDNRSPMAGDSATTTLGG